MAIGAIFIFTTLYWVLSARKWFTGPVRYVSDSGEALVEPMPSIKTDDKEKF